MAKQTTDDPKGRWLHVRNLTESGQAWLFIVKDSASQSNNEYVRKVLKNPRRLPRFQLEVDVTKALAKAGKRAVPIIDAYLEPNEGERAYYVAPYFPNGNLGEKLKAGTYVGNLLSGLNVIEELYGLLCEIHLTTAHRDLKPANILIDEHGRMVLCDFGICIQLMQDMEAERISETLEQMGSRHYIAPEAQGGYRAVRDPVTLDVYAFGKIVYEVVAGVLLPGLETPKDEFNLSSRHGERLGWSDLNELISNLLSQDKGLRMAAWYDFPKTIAFIRQIEQGVGS